MHTLVNLLEFAVLCVPVDFDLRAYAAAARAAWARIPKGL